jgi:hypothetical protein
VRLLVPTLPRYTDSASRQSVLSVVSAILSRDYGAPSSDDAPKSPSYTPGLIKFLEAETAKVEKSAAPGTRFALLGWATTIYSSVPVESPLEDAPWASLTASLSTLLSVVLDKQGGAKESLKKSALVLVRRAVRSVRRLSHPLFAEFCSPSPPQRPTFIPRLVKTLASAKVEPSYKHAPLIGLAMDVALRLKNAMGEPVAGEKYVEESKVRFSLFLSPSPKMLN